MADIGYYILYYILGYRKDVVRKNLSNAFPNKSKEELKSIEKKYYQHLCNLFFEIMKCISFNKNSITKRFHIEKNEDLNKSYSQGKDVVLLCGHYNNWELWASAMPSLIDFNCVAVYKPLSNSFADIKTKEIREKHGMKMISMNESIKYMIQNKGLKNAYIFLADQSPSNMANVHWNTFLNQETPWMLGGVTVGKKLDHEFYFAYIEQIKRGNYKVKFKKISNSDSDLNEQEILDIYSTNLEKIIKEKPQYWLWSHKRWKRKRSSNV